MLRDFSGRIETFNRPWYKASFNLIKFFPKDIKIIELGSGNGEYAKMLKQKFKFFHCCEGDSLSINKLKKIGLQTSKFNFNYKFPFKDNSFDLAISLEVIEHLVEPERFLGEIKRILKPKGRLLISTTNISWFGYRLLSLMGKTPYKAGYHLQFYNYYKLKENLEAKGFKIIATFSITPIPILAQLFLKFFKDPVWIRVIFWQNLLAQNLIFLAQKN